MRLEFNVVLANALTRVRGQEELEVIVRDLMRVLGVEFHSLTKEELEDLIDSEITRRTNASETMRVHVKQLREERDKAINLALAEGRRISSVRLSEGLKEYMVIFWQRGYTTRAIEKVLGVSDSTVSRYTRGVMVVKEGNKRGQVIELLESLQELNIQEFRKCNGTDKSYENTANNKPYTRKEKIQIRQLSEQGKTVQEIAEIVGRKSLSHIKSYMVI